MNNCYIASGWFSPEWLQEVEDIKSVLDKNNLNYFSPKDFAICPEEAGLGFQDEVFEGNIKNLYSCNWMICNTRAKDMGSIFEAGFMHSLSSPIVYFCAGLPAGAKFNLMLSRSSVKVCTSIEELDDYLSRSVDAGELLYEPYEGSIE